MKCERATVCVVGLGPAGLGVALALSLKSGAGIVCVDAGQVPHQRHCPTTKTGRCDCSSACRVITGLGGSSLMGGGKISVLPAGRGLIRVIGSKGEHALNEALDVLSRFFRLSSPRQIRVEEGHSYYGNLGFSYRHYEVRLIGKDDLTQGYEAMASELLNRGVAISLKTEVQRITESTNGFIVHCIRDGEEVQIITDRVVLATGRHGHALLSQMDEGFGLDGTGIPLDYGVRLEFPVSVWPDIDRYHEDLKLEFANARTYCVCKNGVVVNYCADDMTLLEGHSDTNRTTGFTNLSVLVRRPYSGYREKEQVIRDIAERVRTIAGRKVVRQPLPGFMAGQAPTESCGSGTNPYWEWGDVGACWPVSEARELRDAVQYFATRILAEAHHQQVSVYAPELHNRGRKYPITSEFRSRKDGMYLVGECTGHFRGILQSFCSGLWCGQHLLTEAQTGVQQSIRI